jgi:predicted phosphohydrolase
VPIIACFGNEEYIHTRSEITSLIGDRVSFVDESTTVKLISGSSIGVVGASTLIDKSVDLSEIRMIFENRAEKISQLLQEVAKDSDHTILLLHYSPLLERHTDPESFSWWVSKAVGTTKLSLVIHGHLHDSPKHKVMIGATPVFNVALPAVGSITELTL